MKQTSAFITIIGRPNVGKSTLFNKLIGRRLSIVDDTPGVTRDRIYGDCEWRDKTVMLVDTGGIEPESDDIILSQMRRHRGGQDRHAFVKTKLDPHTSPSPLRKR